MDVSQTLNELLQRAGQYHPIYRGGLATHLPMVLMALQGLQASKATLMHTFQTSTDELALIGSLESINAVEDVMFHLGDRSQFKPYLKYFKHQLAMDGADAVLKRVLPLLMPGLAASAFHALIRLAYAIEASHDNEIAIALAYWCSEFQSFTLIEQPTNESLDGIFERLAPLGEKYVFSPGIIVDRMSEMAVVLNKGGHRWQPETLTFSGVRQFCAETFHNQNNFTLLHTVTGCHAFSVIVPYLKDVEHAVKMLWQAIVIAYLSTGLGYSAGIKFMPKGGEENIKANFETVIAAARLSREPHVIKLVYTCLQEYNRYHEPLYLQLAQRAILGGYD
ncbi:questin oxidase family protein [uncultured Shewanella sp.]|uniref:questin oxidase family protein n=1 Tax=uncultured Shewanella sp. TaxID=173975 RepID=UPI002633E601|nr:questin oxidase family protein [uncultured Shewanella sp.]